MSESIYEYTDPEIESAIKGVDPVFVEIEGITDPKAFDSEEPFMICLMNHDNNEVRFQTLQNKLASQAKALGLKTGNNSQYDKMRKTVFAAHKDLLPRVSPATPIGTGFTGMEQFFGDNEVNYGQFVCTDTGISGTTIQGIPFVVCGHPIIISKRSVNILSNVETVDITYFIDGEWKTIRQIPRADIASAQKIVPILAARGVNITSESAKSMVNFLSVFDQLNRQIIPRARTTDTIGWMPDGSFVPYDGDIEVDAMSSDQSLASMSASLHSKGDPEVWLDGVRKLRGSADSVPIRMMTAASFASVLVEPLGRLPGWVHMVGKGTSGKTISLRLAASIWGKNEVSDGWMRNMNSTKVGLEVLAGFAHNLPLCLNELQTVQNLKDFDDIVYVLVECAGKTRGAAGGGLRKTYSWRLFIISCGEMQIVTDASREGANSRVLEILVDHMLYGDPEKGEPQRFCSEVLDKSYGHAGPMFVKGLKNEDMNALSEEFVKITSELIKHGKVPKQADTAALMLIADRLAEKYVFQDGIVLTIDDVLGYLKDQETIDDNRKAYEAVKSLISENINNFAVERIVTRRDQNGNEYETTEITEPRGRVWGKIADSGKTVMIDQRIFNTELKELGYDAMRTIRWCLEKNLVEDGHTASHTSATKQKRFTPGGPKTWCYVFHFNEDSADDPKAIPPQTPQQEEDVKNGFTHVHVEQTELPF